jgi:hypothetical protein
MNQFSQAAWKLNMLPKPRIDEWVFPMPSIIRPIHSPLRTLSSKPANGTGVPHLRSRVMHRTFSPWSIQAAVVCSRGIVILSWQGMSRLLSNTLLIIQFLAMPRHYYATQAIGPSKPLSPSRSCCSSPPAWMSYRCSSAVPLRAEAGPGIRA